MADIRFKAVVLDLFDTLVKWDPGKLPTIDWRGRRVPSTIPLLLPRLRQSLAEDFDELAYLEAYHQVIEEIIAQRQREAIEITCLERFIRTLRRLNAVHPDLHHSLANELRLVHMAAVRSVTAAPPGHPEAVRRLAGVYRLGLLSNFDDSDTGRQILEDTGVAHLFEAVIISADVALRKPNPLIFERMMEMLGLTAGEILFVGDTAREDVLGAQSAGIPVAWLSDGKDPFPEDLPAPDYVLRHLGELPDLLGA